MLEWPMISNVGSSLVGSMRMVTSIFTVLLQYYNPKRKLIKETKCITFLMVQLSKCHYVLGLWANASFHGPDRGKRENPEGRSNDQSIFVFLCHLKCYCAKGDIWWFDVRKVRRKATQKLWKGTNHREAAIKEPSQTEGRSEWTFT